jgi:hypothetical protein
MQERMVRNSPLCLLVTICTWLSACTGDTCTVAEANELIEEYIFSVSPQMNKGFKVDVREYVDDGLSKMNVQMFKNKTTPYENYDFLISDKKVIQLGGAFGGFGITSYCISDLNNDSEYEIVYAYSHGSGISRMNIGLWSETLSSLGSLFTYRGTLKLEKNADGRIFMYDAYYDDDCDMQKTNSMIGEIVLRENEGGYYMDIIYNENIDDNIEWKIWIK